jgi:hypothetical protein
MYMRTPTQGLYCFECFLPKSTNFQVPLPQEYQVLFPHRNTRGAGDLKRGKHALSPNRMRYHVLLKACSIPQ